jgi:hypothetical protein
VSPLTKKRADLIVVDRGLLDGGVSGGVTVLLLGEFCVSATIALPFSVTAHFGVIPSLRYLAGPWR